jgi:hypothetical protein
MWIRRQVLRTVRRLAPEQVQAEVTTSVRRLGTDLRAAVVEARDSMAEREAELRAELAPGTAGSVVAGGSARATPAGGRAALAGGTPDAVDAIAGTAPHGGSRRFRRRGRGAAGTESANGEPARHH